MDFTQNRSYEAFKMPGNWELHSKALQGKYSELTDEDLKYETGKENELLGRVESRLNKKREEVIKIIRDLQSDRI